MNFQINAQQNCEKCTSILWDINKYGNHTCQNCGFIQSMGYITYENEMYQNIEEQDQKGLSRVLYPDGQLYIKGVYQQGTQNQKKKQETNELSLDIFNQCMKIIQPLFQLDQKEIFIQQQDYIQQLNQQMHRINNNADVKDFAYDYFYNQLKEFVDLNQQQQLSEQLKMQLGIKNEKKIKTFNLSQSLTLDQKFVSIMLNLYPTLTEQQIADCIKRLDDIQNLKDLSCNQNSLLCLAAYDLLSNSFMLKKINIHQIAEITQKVLDSQRAIKESKIKQLFKTLQKLTQSQNNYKHGI
ncbi:hypothetical protein ABPG74_022931 [Tetrahymena malaccensis]